jgi:acyl-CoA synthetase (AMP-forming)/AMP-acid ligase II
MHHFPGMVLTEARAKAYLEQGIWANESYVDVLMKQVAAHPNVEHRDENRTLTYHALWQEVESFAASLYQLGVRKGDRVALQLPNCLDYVVALFATARLGAVSVLLQTDLGRDQLLYSLKASGAKVWVVTDSFRGESLLDTAMSVRQSLPDLTHIVLQGETPVPSADLLRFSDLAANKDRCTEAEIIQSQPGPLDPFVMVFTSGTTGSPKGVVQLHANYLWSARAYAAIYGYSPGEGTLDMAPICHQTGMLAGVMMPIATGGRILLMERFSAARALRWMGEERPTYLVGAPPHVIHVANAPGLVDADTSSVRVFLYAGAPVPAAVLRRLQEQTSITVGGMFGWSEGFVACCTRMDDDIEAISRTVGQAVPGIEIRLVDEDGKDVLCGQPGEMWARGPNFSAGYYGNPEASAKQWDEDGWFHSGDVLTMDESLRYRFIGRADDIINRGGTKIDPKLVEDALAAHPAIATAAVIGVPNETLGQSTVACILLGDGQVPPDKEELRSFLSAEGLAKFQIPDRFEYLTVLPMTHSGKIMKRELRRHYTALEETH